MNLPEDIILAILSILPVRSLFRFRCVCKSWYNLLSDPQFVSKHYKATSEKNLNSQLLVSRRDNLTNKRVISLFTNENASLDAFMDQDMPPFLNGMFGHIRLIGPCHGIVCLYGFPDNIAVWNPATRDFKVLPPSPILRPADEKVRGGDLGVGFDSSTNDLKVIQILFCASKIHSLIYQVEIYSLATNSWRKYDTILPANIMYCSVWSTIHGNERFCWWAKDGDVEVILSFDMRNEVFHKTKLPSDIEDFGGKKRTTRAILPLKESIALVIYHLKEVDKIFDVWVINELSGPDGVWTRVSSIGPLSGVARPLGFWQDGEFVLENSCGELIFFDPNKQEMKNLGIFGKRDRLEVLFYKESLLKVNQVNGQPKAFETRRPQLE